MLMMTSERCPDCGQIIYMKLHPKLRLDGTLVQTPDNHADGCYLDQDGVLCITKFDEESHEPTYKCIFCGWSS